MITWPWERDDERRRRERRQRRADERSVQTDQPTPYRDDREHLVDELVRLDYVLWLRVQQWRESNGGGTDEFAGYYISDETVDKLLELSSHGWGTDPVTEGVLTEAHFQYLQDITETIAERKDLTRREGTELRLVRVADRFGLERADLDVLLVGVAPEIDPKYETIFAYLHDDVTRKRPTVDLVLRTFAPSTDERLRRRTVFARTSPLREHRLVRLSGDDSSPLPTRAIQVDERVVNYLLGIDVLGGTLADVATVREPTDDLHSLLLRRPDSDDASEESADDTVPRGKGVSQETPTDARRAETAEDETNYLERLTLDDEVSAQLDRIAGWTQPPDDEERSHLLTHLYGPYGSGRSVTVAALCADWEQTLLTADAQEIRRHGIRETVEMLLREARLRDAVLAVSNLEALGDDDADVTHLLRSLDDYDGRVFVVGTDTIGVSHRLGVTDHVFVSVEFPVPSYDRRRELWKRVAHLPADVNVTELAGKFRLTAGQIVDAVDAARSRTYGGELTADDIYAGCRLQSREKLGSLGRIVTPGYGWDDIVLPPDKEAHLKEVAAHVEHQGRVYSDWGFKEKFSLGNGVVALFTGPSGTGKTMAAEIIAHEVGLDLYKIDLSSVVSKYIGETEKNLGQVFDEAANSDAILLFDEADALFGKRSEVSDAHDRYANIEVNYLLQRVEEHDGAVILTTNFKQNIDDAFLRRIHLSVDFPRPQRDARKRIWEGIFPVDTTPCRNLDYDFLSKFEVTGGHIKNVALTAAFLAASGKRTVETEKLYSIERETIEGLIPEADEISGPLDFWFLDRVEMEHLVWGIRREYQKSGKLIEPEEFGEYRGLLE